MTSGFTVKTLTWGRIPPYLTTDWPKVLKAFLGGVGDCRGQFLLFELRDRSWDLDVLSPLQPLLTVDQVVNPIHQNLHQLHLKMPKHRWSLNTARWIVGGTTKNKQTNQIYSHLWFSQSVVVGNVKGVPGSGCVHTSCASFLEPQVVQDFRETWVLQCCKAMNFHQLCSCVKKW